MNYDQGAGHVMAMRSNDGSIIHTLGYFILGYDIQLVDCPENDLTVLSWEKALHMNPK